jgi:hypothetical protein
MDFVIWALALELYLSFASMRQSAGPHGLAKTNGKPTKRIVCTSTSESAAGGRLTYEKELLNFRKDSHFYKTNHPSFPRALPPYDANNNILCIYACNDKGKLLSNTQFPPPLRSVICLFEA